MNSTKLKLKEIATVVAGQSPESRYYNNEKDGYPFLQGNRTFGFIYPEFDTWTTRLTKKAVEGSVLLSVRAPVGDLNIAPQDLCIGRGLASITAIDGNNKFLFYALKYNIQNLISAGSGTTFTSVNRYDIENLHLILPIVGQRKYIEKLLSALDDKIELNRKINAELEQMARTLYDYWFVQFDFPDANGKPYKSSGGQMVYSDQLKREIPEGWQAVQLEDILNKRTENAEPNSNLRCIDLSVMPSGSLSIDNFSAGDAFNSNMKKMHKKDILFGSIRPYLKKAGLAPFDGLRAGTVHAFYPRKPEHLEFCLITMTSERYFDYAISRSGGSTRMPSISSGDLLDYSVPFSEDVYFKYHKVLTSFTDAISNNIQQSQKLAELRDWLLPMLMNGQVKVV